MGFRLRKNIRLGPLRLNLTQNGLSSWSIKLSPWTWNSRRGHTIDTPGPGYWRP